MTTNQTSGLSRDHYFDSMRYLMEKTRERIRRTIDGVNHTTAALSYGHETCVVGGCSGADQYASIVIHQDGRSATLFGAHANLSGEINIVYRA